MFGSCLLLAGGTGAGALQRWEITMLRAHPDMQPTCMDGSRRGHIMVIAPPYDGDQVEELDGGDNGDDGDDGEEGNVNGDDQYADGNDGPEPEVVELRKPKPRQRPRVKVNLTRAASRMSRVTCWSLLSRFLDALRQRIQMLANQLFLLCPDRNRMMSILMKLPQ